MYAISSPPSSPAAAAAYGNLTVEGTDRAYAADPALSGNGTRVHALSFDGPPAHHEAAGTVLLNLTLLEDAAGNAVGAEHAFSQALSGGGQMGVLLATETPLHTALDTIPFTMGFGRSINATTLDASDINATSGTVRNLERVFSANGSLGAAQLADYPYGVAVNGTGHVYVADRSNHRIAVFGPDGAYTGQITGLRYPRDVSIHGVTGDVYVADTGSGLVRIFNGTGHPLGELAGRFNGPEGLAVDGAAGRVYVADTANHRVAVFDTATRQEIAVLPGTFAFPIGVAADPLSGNVYVVDAQANMIRVFNSTWDHIHDIAGMFALQSGVAVDPSSGTLYAAETDNGVIAVFNGTWDRIAQIDPPGRPIRMAVDPSDGTVYAVNDVDRPVRAYDPGYAFEVAGVAAGEVLAVNIPQGAVRDTAGNENAASGTVRINIDRMPPVPVVGSAHPDPTNATVIGFTVHFDMGVRGFGADDITLGGTAALDGGVRNFARADGGATTAPAANYTFEVSPVADGTVLVGVPAGAARDPAGNPSAASARFTIVYDGTPPRPVAAHTVDEAAVDSSLQGISVTPLTREVRSHGGVWYTGLESVPMGIVYRGGAVNASTVEISDVNATLGTVSDPRWLLRYNTTFGPGPGAPGAGGGQLDHPYDVALDGTAGYAYVADTENDRIAVFEGATGRHVANITDGLDTPYGVAVDPATGTVYVADTGNDRVRVFNHTGARASWSSAPADPGPAWQRIADIGAGRLDSPRGVAVDGATGDIYVADSDNDRVAVFDGAGRYASEIADGFDFPAGVEVDGAAGRIYVADSNNDRVAVFNRTGGFVTNVTDGMINLATDVAVDPATGTVYVADFVNERIAVFNGTGHNTANIVRAVNPLAGGTVPRFDHSFNTPAGVGVDPVTGALYVADTFDHEVHRFDVSYAFDVGGLDHGDRFAVGMPAGAVRDAAGNPNAASEVAAEVVIDRVAPVPVINSTQPDPTNSTVIEFTVAWGENVTGFGPGDVRVSGVRLSAGDIANFTGTGANYTFEVRPAADGTVRIEIPAGSAHDLAGNAGTGAAPFEIVYDTGPPVPVITAAQRSPTNSTVINLRVEWGENVTGFGAGDVRVSGATVYGGGAVNLGGLDGYANYTFEVRPADDGKIRTEIPAGSARDLAGNPGTAGIPLDIVYDSMGPVPEVTAVQSSPTYADTVNIRVEWGEPVEGFDRDDIIVSGTALHGGVENLAGAGANYTFDISPTGDGSLLVDIRPGAVPDPAGNPSVPGDRLVMVYTGSSPIPRIAAAAGDPTRLQTVPFILTFSEHVDEDTFDASDLRVSSGTVRNLEPAVLHTDLGNGTAGAGTGRLDRPSGVAVDTASGTVYVADTGNGRIAVFNTARHHTANITAGFGNPAGVGRRRRRPPLRGRHRPRPGRRSGRHHRTSCRYRRDHRQAGPPLGGGSPHQVGHRIRGRPVQRPDRRVRRHHRPQHGQHHGGTEQPLGGGRPRRVGYRIRGRHIQRPGRRIRLGPGAAPGPARYIQAPRRRGRGRPLRCRIRGRRGRHGRRPHRRIRRYHRPPHAQHHHRRLCKPGRRGRRLPVGRRIRGRAGRPPRPGTGSGIRL